MKVVETFRATIFVGFRERYSQIEHSLDEAEEICQSFCDKVGLCVTVSPTRYIYTQGNENGCEIGLINYPRFPTTRQDIIHKSFQLAEELMLRFNQFRMTIVTQDKTYMLENDIETT